ncbi:phage portal protein [uncultured Sphaerochaeta sp.]|uniref:phage portal protein n=1 Tax=uncultured Sphaerochaeta sp. TaxID=886478 RepID=UPI002A0A1AA4|nr:phage portal protein [uncultured Sphaerochaeta sp.]
MIPIYTYNFKGTLAETEIMKAIAAKEQWNVELDKLDKYYKGNNPSILAEDRNHKVPIPFGRKLIKSTLGFMFKEGCITYKYPDSDEKLKEKIKGVFDFNDEQTEDIRLARDQATYGSAFEVLFIDNPDALPQFYRIPARQLIPVYLPDIKPKMGAAINFYTINDTERHVDVYYKDRIEKFTRKDNGLKISKTIHHQFGEVPIAEFRNNEEGQGDIECVLGLIDSHDEILSNGLDEDGKFADALLLLKNAVLDDEQIAKIRDKRILDDLDSDAEVSYLVKENSYAGREVLRAKIEDLIYSMSGIPNLSDSKAMAQQSGEALKYLYATFEVMVAGDKQSGFNDGLTKRLHLICSYLNWLEGKGEDDKIPASGIPVKYKSDEITISWKRNLPAEATTTIDNATKIEPYVSRRTFLEQLNQAGVIEDVSAEETRLEEEAQATLNINEKKVLEGYGA